MSDLGTAELLANRQSALVNYTKTVPFDRVDELLVRCYAKRGNTFLFRFFLTDRMDVMKQSILNYDTDFLTIHLSEKSDENESYTVVFREKKIFLHSVFLNFGFFILNPSCTNSRGKKHLLHSVISKVSKKIPYSL